MTELIAVALALGVGMDWRRLAVLTAALVAPGILLVGIASILWRQRRPAEGRAAVFCEGVASELRSGATLTQGVSTALAASGTTSTSRSGRLSAGAGPDLRLEFPEIGRELDLILEVARRTGSKAADLFDEIGSLAIAQQEISHEVRVATAPARATTIVFLAAPLTYLLIRSRSGGLGLLTELPAQRLAGLAGLVLFLTGLTVMALMTWRAR